MDLVHLRELNLVNTVNIKSITIDIDKLSNEIGDALMEKIN